VPSVLHSLLPPLSLHDTFPPLTLPSPPVYISHLSLHCIYLPTPNTIHLSTYNPPLTTHHLSTFCPNHISRPYQRPWFIWTPQHDQALNSLNRMKSKPRCRGGAMWQLRGDFGAKSSVDPNHPRQFLKSHAYMMSGHHVTSTHLHVLQIHSCHPLLVNCLHVLLIVTNNVFPNDLLVDKSEVFQAQMVVDRSKWNALSR